MVGSRQIHEGRVCEKVKVAGNAGKDKEAKGVVATAMCGVLHKGRWGQVRWG